MLGLELWKKPFLCLGRLCERTYTWIKKRVESWLYDTILPFDKNQEDDDLEEFLEENTFREEETFDFTTTRGYERFYDNFFHQPSTVIEVEEIRESLTVEKSPHPEPQKEKQSKIGQRQKQTYADFFTLYVILFCLIIYVVYLSQSQKLKQNVIFEEPHISYRIVADQFSSKVDLEDYDLFHMQTFFENSTPKQAKEEDRIVMTAFPALGETFTCECWLLKPALVVRRAETLAARTLFFDHKSLGNELLIDPFTGAEGQVLKTVAGCRHYLLVKTQPCSCEQVEYWIAETCHKGSQPNFEAHRPILKATVNLMFNKNGGRGVYGVNVYDDKNTIPLRGGLEATEFSCEHVADEVIAQRLSKTIYRPKRANIPDFLHPERNQDVGSPKITTMQTDYSYRYEHILSFYISEVERKIESKYHQLPQNWVDGVKLAWSTWDKEYLSDADTTMKTTGEFELPNCVKRRLTSIKEKLKKIASSLKVYPHQQTNFGVVTREEWLARVQERYALAATMSRSELIKTFPQQAKEWLKTDRAKHMLNQVVRHSLTNPSFATQAMEKFNKELSKWGGSPLPLPDHLIAKAKANLDKSDELRAKQKEATKNRERYVGWVKKTTLVEQDGAPMDLQEIEGSLRAPKQGKFSRPEDD